MQPLDTKKQKCLILFLTIIFAGLTGHTQQLSPKLNIQEQPVWWFGASGAANFNNYRGTTQMINNNLTVPTAFHKGHGIKPYISLLAEYRPNKVWGGMLNVAFDNRGGKFNRVKAPCNCAADLSTNVSYLTVEPSLRLAPFASSFYLFAGPSLSLNMSKGFTYAQEKQTTVKGDWSDIRSTVFSAQAGAGIDILVSARNSESQMSISPFVSFLTDFGHNPRKTESWSVYSIRTGIAFKFGRIKKTNPLSSADPAPVPVVLEKQVEFSVRAPKEIPLERQVKETFPLRNSVFFDKGSTEIPKRYIHLTNAQALDFKETQLQQDQPNNLAKGRSSRQLEVYYNILNIIGDRMRSNAFSNIVLTGSSDKNPTEGRILAENIKQYLVKNFGISSSRFTTVGRDKPLIPSEQRGGTKELALLREGDHRVDITSISPELLLEVGGNASTTLKPVEIIAIEKDPLDSYVIFNVMGANDLLKSWSVEVADEHGNIQHYGPFTQDQAAIPGKTILGDTKKGNYTITMVGETKTGITVKKVTTVSFIEANDPKQQGLRYSILFDFDKSKTIASYEKFLREVITPLIPENGKVIIHGHTDIIGEEKYNQALSHDRALGTQQILEKELAATGKKNVSFESYGFGEAADTAPFQNNLPEERFYNRTVIIDITSSK